eukprot:gene17832-biopygen15069
MGQGMGQEWGSNGGRAAAQPRPVSSQVREQDADALAPLRHRGGGEDPAQSSAGERGPGSESSDPADRRAGLTSTHIAHVSPSFHSAIWRCVGKPPPVVAHWGGRAPAATAVILQSVRARARVRSLKGAGLPPPYRQLAAVGSSPRWRDYAKGKRRPRTKDPAEVVSNQQRRAVDLTRDGQFAKACKALTSAPPVEASDDSLRMLRDKHPRAQSQPDLSDLGPPAFSPSISVDLVRKTILAFPRGSAPGPSGLRPQHLKDAVKSVLGDECVEQITGWVNVGAGGGRSACATSPAPMLWNTSGRDRSESRHRWVSRSGNAFNTIDREVFLREVRSRLPGLSKWVEWCYGAPSNLLFAGNVIASELASDPDLYLTFFYLDDGYIAGENRAVARAMERLTAMAARVGLQLCSRKCEVIAAAPPPPPAAAGSGAPSQPLVDPPIPPQ